MTRIWPAGQYTVELRQSHVTAGGVLQRGKEQIEMCYQCGPLAPQWAGAPAGAVDTPNDWGVFGAGPWISWGAAGQRRAVRWYDLWGAPDRQTPFADVTWLNGTGGAFRDGPTGFGFTWTAHDLGLPDARAFDVSVADARVAAYTFSMAIDPDVGPNPADDRASYDAARGLVIVADQERAVGFLLRQGAGNALAAVQEYGVGHFAPTTAQRAGDAASDAGVHLIGTPRDVQLLLTTGAATGPGTWFFAVIRGADVPSVQATADAVIRARR